MKAATALAASLGLLAPVALAHHSYSAFDMDKTSTLQGTVTKFQWTNPHAFLYVAVADGKGGAEEWRIESVSPVMMAKAGFKRDSFKVGDKVTVTVHPARDPHEKQANFMGAKWADGREMVMGFARGPGGPGAGGPGRGPAGDVSAPSPASAAPPRGEGK